MTQEVVAIGELVRKTKQLHPSALGENEFTYIDIAAVDRFSKSILAPQRIAAMDAPSRARKLVEGRDILVSTVRPNLNSIAMVPNDLAGAVASTGFCILRADPRLLDPDYLFYFVQTSEFVNRLVNVATGASYPAVTDGDVFEVLIPSRSVAEQRAVSKQLRLADRLRRTRRYAQTLSDTFLQSVFLEMFGDLKKWNSIEFGECFPTGAKNGLYLPASKYGSGVPIIRINNFYSGKLTAVSGFRRVEASDKEKTDFDVENGDLLINRVNSLEYLGKCALVDGLTEATVYESNMMRIRINRDTINPIYLVRYLVGNEAQMQIRQRAKKAVNQASINQHDVESLRIPLPPLDLQVKFAAVALQYGRIGLTEIESTRQADHLFHSLLHRAFQTEK